MPVGTAGQRTIHFAGDFLKDSLDAGVPTVEVQRHAVPVSFVTGGRGPVRQEPSPPHRARNFLEFLPDAARQGRRAPGHNSTPSASMERRIAGLASAVSTRSMTQPGLRLRSRPAAR